MRTSYLKGSIKNLTSSRVIETSRGVFQIEAGIGREGMSVRIDTPEMAEYLAALFRRAAFHLKNNKGENHDPGQTV